MTHQKNEALLVSMYDLRKDLTSIIDDLRYNDSVYLVQSYKKSVAAIVPMKHFEKLMELTKGDKDVECN